MRMIFTLFCAVLAGNLYAQNSKAYLFIEPNVSLSYDNTLLRVKDSVFNSVHGTSGYSFNLALPNRTGSVIDISTEPVVTNINPNAGDSLYKALVNQINRYAGDSIAVQTKKFVSYKGFSGLSYIAMHKKRKEYVVAFACTKFLEKGACKLYYSSWGKQPVAGFDRDEAVFASIIDGIQSYSQQQMAKEDSVLQHAYTVAIDTLGMPGFSFAGMVKVKEKLQHVIRGVKVDYQTFLPDYRGNIIVFMNDPEKGRIEKNCELILLSSIGKQVHIPFTFSYYNK